MPTALPEFYFRVRDNGAFVFRIDSSNPRSRIELNQIATVNIRNGEIKPQGDHRLTEDEQGAIRDWMAERKTQLELRATDDVQRLIEQMQGMAHWAQSRASDDQLEAVTDELLLAMHDLRAVLVRKRANRM